MGILLKARLGCSLLLLLAVSLAHAQSKKLSSEDSRLVALENAWNQAQLNHDSNALETLVDDTFIYTDTDGKVMNKDEFLADIQDPAYHMTLVTNEEITVHSYKNVAVAYGTYHAKGSYRGKGFDHRGRFTDTWLFQSGKWTCVASHTTLLRK
jgi:ketosteroid isomerase-like protein